MLVTAHFRLRRHPKWGWFDAVSVRYSTMINGIEEIAITKLDVLDDFDKIKICIGYQKNGKLLKSFPTDVRTLEKIVPVYETFDGWKTKISEITSYNSLPIKARTYIEAISSFTRTKVRMISVGARRDQTIIIP